MFHRFPAAPRKGRGRAARPKNDTDRSDGDVEDSALHRVAKRRKTARACDRCRLHRIRCGEGRPCANCVRIDVECIVSYAPRTSQANGGSRGRELSSSPRPRPDSSSRGVDGNTSSTSTAAATTRATGPSVHLYHMNPRASTNRKSSQATQTSPDDAHREYLYHAAHVWGFFGSGQPASTQSCHFRQLPHPDLPTRRCTPISSALPRNQRCYYHRLFWENCHPLLQIMSESEFAELYALPDPARPDDYSERHALVDAMIALGIQHSRAAGLAGRVLGLQQSSSQQSSAPSSSGPSWLGFEYFNRCRECMRTITRGSLDALRCHALMVFYLIRGNAFREAYNLLGITVRKAYMARLHRLPPSHLPEPGRTARMQLWWTMFYMDLQCSLQLDMPAASQKSLVRCPFPAKYALARYLSCPSSGIGGIEACAYSTYLVDLTIVVSDIGAYVSTMNLDDDGSPGALEHQAINLLPRLQSVEDWRQRLPSGLLLSRGGSDSDRTEMPQVALDLALPLWQQRQMVFLDLHYHNTYVLIQRPFIRFRHAHPDAPGPMVTPADSSQQHVELSIASAVYHAMAVAETVFVVCSMSDAFHGWSEVLQPLWNAALTIMAYVYVSAPSPVKSRALESLAHAQDVFECFASTSPTAVFANGIVQSVASSLRKMTENSLRADCSADHASRYLFQSLMDNGPSLSGGLGNSPSDDLQNGGRRL